MPRPIQVSASILCADFTKLGEEIKKCEEAGVDSIHVDVMDGHFVPTITIGQIIVKAIRPITKLPIETHLMIEYPWDYIDQFIDVGADIVSIHVECYGKLKASARRPAQYPKAVDKIDVRKAKKDIDRIKQRGKKVFLVINPGTPLCLGSLLKDVDGVLVMSVNPGYANQKFMPEVLPKIERLRKEFYGDISIDGGINGSTASQAVKAGANILATASYFFGSNNPKELVRILKKLRPN